MKLVGVSSISGDSLTAEWLPISDTKIEPTKILYTLHVSDQPSFTPTSATAKFAQTGVNQTTVNNLLAGQQYYVKVVATGDQGQESWSNEFAIVTPELIADRNNSTTLVQQSSQSPQVTDHSVSYQDTVSPVVGNFLVGTESGGYLRKVAAVSRQGNTVVADTEPASLNEVFDTLDVHLVTQLYALPEATTPVAANASTAAAKTKSLKSIGRSVSWPQTGLTLMDSGSQTGNLPLAASAKQTLKTVASSISVDGDLQTNHGKNLQFTGPAYWALRPDELATFTLDAKIVGNSAEPKQICKIHMTEFSHVDSTKQQIIKNDLGTNRTLQVGNMVTRDAEQAASLNVVWQPGANYVHDGGLPYYAIFEAVVDDKSNNCDDGFWDGLWNNQETLRLKIPVYITMGEIPSQKQKTLTFQDGFSVEDTVSFSLQPEFDITARIEGARLKSATMAANLDIDMFQQLKIHADGAAVLDQTKEMIEPRQFIKVFSAGGVPIVVSGQFRMNMRVQGNAHGAIDLTQALRYGFPNAQFGLRYENGAWQTIQDIKPEYTFSLDGEGNAGAELKITLIPDLQIHFYDSASGRMLLEPYVYTQAGIHGQFKYQDTNGVWLQDPPDYWFTDLQAGAGMNLRLYAGLHIFDYNIASYPDDVTVNEPNKFKFVSAINKTPVLGIPGLTANADLQASPSGIDSRAIQIKGNHQNLANPFKSLFGIGPDAWVKFERWTQPRLVTTAKSASVIPDSTEPGVFWLRFNDPGTYLVRLAGHSTLGQYIRQTAETTVTLTDNDKDGLVDQWETRYGLNPNQANNTATDHDGDSLGDVAEYQAGTNPNNRDSDADGYTDLQERNGGSDPLNPASTPSGVINCSPPKVQDGANCVDPQISNVTPISGSVGQAVDITITGSHLPPTLVLGIDGQSQPCAILNRSASEAVFNCALDVAGTWDLQLLSNSTLNGGVAILNSFSSFAVNADSNTNTPTIKLNDTGITACSNFHFNGDCPVEGFPRQDAQYGRDAQALAGTLQKVGGGNAGFDFTKLDSNGNPLPASATAWNCVKDNITGLIWEVKTDDGGLRDKDNTYTWYEPDNSKNGGNAGGQNGGGCIGSSCDTFSYIQAVNAQALCGAGDWRMPNRNELLSIVDNSRINQSIHRSQLFSEYTCFACLVFVAECLLLFEPRVGREFL